MDIKYPQLLDRKWLKKQLESKSKLQIAEELGCSYSAVTFYTIKYGLKTGRNGPRRKSKTRSENLKQALRESPRLGDKSSNWKGGIRPNYGSKGRYIGVYAPAHPYAVKGAVMQHRLVVEKKLGRYLTPLEIVHHKNGNTKDNRLKNLQLTTKKKHFKNHYDAVKYVEKGRSEITRLRALLKKHGIDPDQPSVV